MNRFQKLLLKFDEMSEREQDVMTDALAQLLLLVALWPLTKRYYAKRGAPRWVAPAVFGIGLRLVEISSLLRRQEKQAIRDSKRKVNDKEPTRIFVG